MVLGDPENRALRDDLPRLARGASEEAGRVGRIARGMRNLASVETDELESVDVHELLDRALSTLPTSIEVQRAYAQAHPIPVFPKLFAQLLRHVLDNSVRAMGGSGTVVVQTHLDDGMLELSLPDNGKGIAEAALPHVFEPYFTTEMATGMGLYHVYRIADRHGGTVSMESVPGRGARLTVRLPLTQIEQ
jgi:signal transduction histidine kinase